MNNFSPEFKIKNFVQLLDFIANHHPNLTLKKIAKQELGISEKSFFSIKGGELPKNKLQRALKYYVETNYGFTYSQPNLENEKIIIERINTDNSNRTDNKNADTLEYLLSKLNKIEIEMRKKDDEIDRIDTEIINSLKKIINPAALSYEQAIIDLKSNQRISWRGPATELRESLRECLDYLAPDTEVISQTGFKLDPDTKGPTMKQKVKYILKKKGIGNSEIETTESAINLVDEMLGKFVRSVYTRASVSTHTSKDRNEILRILKLIRVVFCEILEIN